MAPPPLHLFRGEEALVTGSAANIGRAIALGLAREGANWIRLPTR
jgi:NAD(P)-dependent dehydrogenase (short-subunit alcohol dehydrogenase family)